MPFIWGVAPKPYTHQNSRTKGTPLIRMSITPKMIPVTEIGMFELYADNNHPT